VDVVREHALAVDLDHREPLAVGRLELGVAADVDLDKLEGVPHAHALEHSASPLAEVAPGRGEQRDLDCYGYRPRVVVASATR
jgi:hypothetical protein